MLRCLRHAQRSAQRPLRRLRVRANRGLATSTGPSQQTCVRTRFAPSPTGDLHLGGLRTALFAYLWARRTGGAFVLRIEDTDRKRRVEGAVERILHDLQWCGLHPDEFPGMETADAFEKCENGIAIDTKRAVYDLPLWSHSAISGGHSGTARVAPLGPYMQSERMALGLYQSAAGAMLEADTAYRCFCSSERLDSLREQQTRRGQPVMYDRACSSISREESDRRAATGEPFTVRLRVPVAASHLPAQEERWTVARGLAGDAYASAESGAIEAGRRMFAAATTTGGGGSGGGLLAGSPLAAGLAADRGGSDGSVGSSAASGHGVAGTVVRDVVMGEVPFSHSAVDDCVLLKSDGWPTYHLASVVDDITMRITDVVRGQEWLTSAPKHVLIYRGLGVSDAAVPRFTHLPLLLGPDRKKLSKRAGDASVGDFRERLGVLPAALLNFVAFLGWTPAGAAARADAADVRDAAERSEADVMSVSELASQFSLSDVHRSNAVVDRSRLAWLQGRHTHGALLAAAQACRVSQGAGLPEGAAASSDRGGQAAQVLAAVVCELDAAMLGPTRPETARDGGADGDSGRRKNDKVEEAEGGAEREEGVMRGGWVERCASLGLVERLRTGLDGRAVASRAGAPGALMGPLDSAGSWLPGDGTLTAGDSASAPHSAVWQAETVAEVFHPRFLLLCLLLQHERGDLPATLAPLLRPLLAPPFPEAALPVTPDQEAAFRKAWHGDASSLLGRLATDWECLAHDPAQSDPFALSADLASILHGQSGKEPLVKSEGRPAASAEGAMAAVKSRMEAYAAEAVDGGPSGGGDDGASVGSDGGGKSAARKRRRKRMPASKLMLPLRWALTGQAVGPALSDVVAVLGRSACLSRLRVALEVAKRLA